MSNRRRFRAGWAIVVFLAIWPLSACGDDDTAQVCGNGLIEGSEACDATQLGGATCLSIAGDFTGGALSCNADCTFDTSGCSTVVGCGNGTQEGSEACDGEDLDDQTCADVGNYIGGTLACNGDCTFDTSGCTAPVTCNNGTLDAGEDCDGTNLDGNDCADVGNYVGGTLDCANDCTFDTTSCLAANICGNDLQENNEQCDGDDLNGTTCATVGGFLDGTLACTNNCTFDTSGCNACGNDIQDNNEDCDGTDLGGSTCRDVGTNVGGTLDCNTDCTFDTSSCVANYPVGSLVITEIMKNPMAVADADGEWIEVYNAGAAAIDLEGMQLGSENDATHVIQPSAPLVLQPGDYAVLARNGDTATNGGVTADYVYTGINLANTADTVIIANPSGLVLDAVSYDETNFPTAAGRAMSLDPASLTATANDTGSNWCDSSAQIGLDWDRGSPGQANPSCTPETACDDNTDNDGNGRQDCADPACAYDSACTSANVPEQGDLVIVEMMVEPSGTESEQEWFEILNVSGVDLELNGLQICTGTDQCFLLDFQGSEVLAAGDRALVAASGDPAVNGGIDSNDITYVCGPVLNLPNVAGQLGLVSEVPGDTPVLVDRVVWDTQTDWQITSGAALQFDLDVTPTSVANDDATTWCDARSEYGTAGMLGTPGTENVVCGQRTGNLFFSEYVEGSSNNKAVEIYNGGTTSVALQNCEVWIYFNGSNTANTQITLDSTILGPGGTWVVCDNNSDTGITDRCNQQDNHGFFNGDDAVELICDSGALDVIGQIGTDPGSAWTGGGLSTQNRTLRRMCSVTSGDNDGSDAFDPSTEWDGFAEDTFDGLGEHCP